MKRNIFKGFTLVELIIVITILAILSTIGFVSFQSYTKTTRDSNRLVTLSNMETGLNIYQAKNNLIPETNSGITIFGSGEIFGYQGTFSDNQSNIIGMSKTPTDPQTGELYIYSTNQAKTKYQLLGFFENSNVVTYKVGNEVLAADNTLKTPKVFGNSLGVVLDDTNNPPTSNVYLTGTTNIKIIISNTNQISGTGIALSKAKSSFKYGKITWGYYDPNCDLDDVVIGNQVWAGCNSTIGSGAERGQTDANIGTNNYSGTINPNGCSKVHDSSIIDNNDCQFGSYLMRSSSNPKEWFPGTNNYGESTFNTIWGKFYTYTGAIQTACPSGWHVPSNNEMITLEKYLGCNDADTLNSNRCSGLGWSIQGKRKLVDILKLPLPGNRSASNAFTGRGVRLQLWTSTQSGGTINTRFIVSSDSSVLNGLANTGTSAGFSVRCIKD